MINEDMKKKLAKARSQSRWQDSFLQHNAGAYVLATKALDAAAGQHKAIRAETQEALEAVTIDLLYLAGQRLCAARLPKGANNGELRQGEEESE